MVLQNFKCTQDMKEAIRAAAYKTTNSNSSAVIIAALEAYPPVKKELQQRCKNKSKK